MKDGLHVPAYSHAALVLRDRAVAPLKLVSPKELSSDEIAKWLLESVAKITELMANQSKQAECERALEIIVTARKQLKYVTHRVEPVGKHLQDLGSFEAQVLKRFFPVERTIPPKVHLAAQAAFSNRCSIVELNPASFPKVKGFLWNVERGTTTLFEEEFLFALPPGKWVVGVQVLEDNSWSPISVSFLETPSKPSDITWIVQAYGELWADVLSKSKSPDPTVVEKGAQAAWMTGIR